ncbi:Fpg/Nei family DNA glycosylase [Sphingobacterium detergens]|uniref:Formamidopyrimidine-DNA glycosylase n=1 Tax=Sphingobacterium detergens TaxID=1145106 RepID=A0A420B6Y1_SPHD1|nr:DNA-formamidopyrimidine glycosylase family protein [Sphingobacterium detergens]RKE52408.1 formamidopyrimidine-DNA glycosylase [Sphingobacterium detergens]
MPELPDLEVFSKNLTKMIKGKTLKSVVIHNKQKIKVNEKDLQQFVGNKLIKVYREGKRLFFDFGKDAVLAVHLMLHGNLVYSEEENPKYALVSLQFKEGQTLSVTDFQKAANIELNPAPAESIDALSPELTDKALTELLQSSKAKIKTVLMDQKIIGGIGNAYADEILYAAGISPLSIANKIPEKQVQHLSKAITAVLKNAQQQILKEHPNIISGEIRDFMKVHHKKAKTDEHGHDILQTKIAGRTSYYTEDQKVFE